MDLDRAVDQWRQGERRLQAAEIERARVLERLVEALVDELRRRLGSRFTAAELAQLYGRGTDWCLQLVMELAPNDPWAWDSTVVVDAAFGRYLRGAADYAGGRHLPAAH